MLFSSLVILSAAASVASASLIAKRQTPPTTFTVYFGSDTSLSENQILMVDRKFPVSSPAKGYYNVSEPLLLTSDFLFTSMFASSASETQELIVDIQHSQAINFTAPDSQFEIPVGFTHTGFSIVDNMIAVNGSTGNFWECDSFVAPGGSFVLYANDPVDTHSLYDGGCHSTVLTIVPSV